MSHFTLALLAVLLGLFNLGWLEGYDVLAGAWFCVALYALLETAKDYAAERRSPDRG